MKMQGCELSRYCAVRLLRLSLKCVNVSELHITFPGIIVLTGLIATPVLLCVLRFTACVLTPVLDACLLSVL